MRSSSAGRIGTDKDRPRQMLGMESYLNKASSEACTCLRRAVLEPRCKQILEVPRLLPV